MHPLRRLSVSWTVVCLVIAATGASAARRPAPARQEAIVQDAVAPDSPVQAAPIQAASLRGTVVDEGGGVLPGATVSIATPDGRVRATTVSDTNGDFRVTGLADGRYVVTAELPGFAPGRVADVEVGQSSAREVRIILRPASVTDAVTVTATRTATPLSQVPQSVTVVDHATLERELGVTDNLTAVLAKTVPGLGPSRETEAIFGQSLRGRDMLVLIDGVPQNFELRVGATDELSRLTSSAVDRVEVVRGASAIFGASAAGGIINIVTRQISGRPRAEVVLGTTFSAVHPGDSVDTRATLSAGGTAGVTSWFAAGAYDRTRGDFDADGNRIPQLSFDSDMRFIDAMGSAGWSWSGSRRIDVRGGLRDARLRRGFAADGGVFGVTPASAVRVPIGYGAATDQPQVPVETPFKRQVQGQAGYSDPGFAAGPLSVRLYAMTYDRRNTFADFFGGQLESDLNKQGGRVDVETRLPIGSGASLHWGADVARYGHVEPMSGGQPFVPEMRQISAAAFGQLSAAIGPRVTARAGVRFEHFRLRIDDFTTHPVYGSRDVEGGTLTYGAPTGNAGLVWNVGENVDVFASFAQGFSVTEVGRLLRDTRLPSVAVARPEAQTVNNIEVGTRARVARADLTASAYRSWSRLGTTFIINPLTGIPEILRAPERISGVEATVAVPFGRWRVGGIASVQRGSYDPDLDDVYSPLPGFRIAPVTASAYVGYVTSPWDAQVRVTTNGRRDVFDGSTNYGEGRVEPITLVDLAGRVALPGGRLSIGVANLLNRLYVPAPNQAFNTDLLYITGRGTTISLAYTVDLLR